MPRRHAITLLLIVSLAAPAASAQTPAVDEADRLIDEGARLFTEDADYTAALDHFTRSYELSPSWRALNGIAAVRSEQGRFVEALDLYERLRREFGPTLSPKIAAAVDKRIAAMLERVGILAVEAPQAGARVIVDGRVVGTGPLSTTVRLLPGPHVVAATLAEHQPYTDTVDVRPARTTTVRIELAPQEVKLVVEERRARVVRPLPTWLPWTVLGAGAALALAGIPFSIAAAGDTDLFDQSVADGWSDDPDHGSVTGDRTILERAHDRETIATVLYTTGAIAALTGLVMVIVNQPRVVESPRARPRLLPSPGGVTLVWSF